MRVPLEKFHAARERIKGVALHTPLMRNTNLSEATGAEVWLKREDLQPVRSYKLRGAYNNPQQSRFRITVQPGVNTLPPFELN